MKKFISLLLCVLMITSMANFSSIVSAVSSVDFSQATVDEANSEDSSEKKPETEDALIDKTITGYYNGYIVEVSGLLPETATLSLTSVDDKTAQRLVSAKSTDGNVLFACDIKVIGADGEKWQPKDGKCVKIKVTGVEETKKDIRFIHVSEDVDQVLAKADPAKSIQTITDVTKGENGELTFLTDGFSTFAGFTVEFHHDGGIFSINGLESIYLSELFRQLNIDRDTSDVIDVSFSDESYISISQEGYDWLLISEKPFSTKEDLAITFQNGEILDIAVTDATVTWANGSSQSGKSYSENTVITIKGNVTLTGTIKIAGYKLTLINGTDGDVKVTRDDDFIMFNLDNSASDLVINEAGSSGNRIILNGGNREKSLIYAKGGSTSGTDILMNYTVMENSKSRIFHAEGTIKSCVLNNCVFDGANTASYGAGICFSNTVTEQITFNNCAFRNLTSSMSSSDSANGGGAIGFAADGKITAAGGFVLNYDDSFANTKDSSGVPFGSAFENCSVSSPETEKRYGGAIFFACEAENAIERFLVHIEPGYMDAIHVFNNCKAYSSGVVHVKPITKDSGKTHVPTVNKIIFDYGYYDVNGDIILDDNNATAIYGIDGKEITDATKKSNISHTDIDAYSMDKNTVITRTGATLKNCYATYRGGLTWLDSSNDNCRMTTELLLDGVIADGNIATDGSVVNLQRVKTENFTYRDCIFINNIAKNNIGGNSAYYGGTVLRCAGTAAAKVSVDNCLFKDNKSFWSGGALYWNAGDVSNLADTSMTIKDSNFIGNGAAYSGGAIFNESIMYVTKTKFTENSALMDGGAIRSTIYSNAKGGNIWKPKNLELSIGRGCVVENNFSGGFGGGISISLRYSQNMHYSWSANNKEFNVNFNMHNTYQSYDDKPEGKADGDLLLEAELPVISGNVAGVSGGGFYMGLSIAELSDSALEGGHDSYYSASSSTPKTITALADAYDTSKESNYPYMQGLVDVIGKNINIYGGKVYNNEAGYDGGGIYANVDNTVISVSNGEIYGNKAGVTNTVSNYLTDSIVANQLKFDCTNFTAIRKAATGELVTRTYKLDSSIVGYGGAICLRGKSSTLNMTGGALGKANPVVDDEDDEALHLYGNRADYGGAVAVNEGTVNIKSSGSKHSDIHYNYAISGAGIYTIFSGAINISGGDITFNHAEANGTLNNAAATTADKTNSSYVTNLSEIQSLRSSMSNVKKGCGGGAYAYNTGSITITGGDIYNNLATDGAGGGVFCGYGGDITMTGGMLYDNEAEYITTPSGNTTYKDAQLRGVGGAIAVSNGTSNNPSSFTLSSSSTAEDIGIYNNIATFAADDVYASGNNTKLNVPDTTEMVIPSENINVRRKVIWFEDFHTSDSNISSSNSISTASSTSLVERYRTAVSNQQYNKLFQIYKTDSTNIGAKTYVNASNAYVNMTLGVSESGGLKVGKTVRTSMGNEDNKKVSQWNTFKITCVSDAFEPQITGIFKMNSDNAMVGGEQVFAAEPKSNPDVRTDYFETVSKGSTYVFRMKNGYYVGFDAQGAYTVEETVLANGVTDTFYKIKNGNSAYSGEINGKNISDIVVDNSSPQEIEFINIVSAFQFTFKYYDRMVESGKPSDISSTESTIEYILLGDKYDEAIANAEAEAAQNNKSVTIKDKLFSMAQTAATDACKLIDNIVDDYEVDLNKGSSHITLHNDPYGSTITNSGVTDPYWINWYNSSGTTQSIADETDAEKVTSGVVWLKNIPKTYNVKVYVPFVSKSGSATTYYAKNSSVTLTDAQSTKLKTADDGGRYVYTQEAESISTYYNQRIGAKFEGTDTDSINDNINRLVQYKKNGQTILGYTGKDVTAPKTITINAGKTLYFSHWSFDEAGYDIAATDLDYHSRILQDTSVYAVYMEDPIKEKGLSVSSNIVDVYVEGSTERVRINTLVNPYNFLDNFGKDNFNNLAGIYAIPQSNVRITSAHIVGLQNWILDYLNSKAPDGSATAGNKSIRITDADVSKYPELSSLKGANFVLYGKPPVSNKNRVNMEVAFDKTKLADNRMLTFAAINYIAEDSKTYWRISDNCIDYQFDENGNSSSVASINEVAITKTPIYIQLVGTATGGSSANAVNMKLNAPNKTATYTVDLPSGTHSFYINEVFDVENSTYGYVGNAINDTVGLTDMVDGITPVTLNTTGGRYIITYNYSTKQFSIERKVPVVTVSGGIAGTMTTVSDTTVQYRTSELIAGTTYTFAVNETIDGFVTTLGSSTTINNTISGLELSASVSDCKFVPSLSGKYLFTYDYITNRLTVTQDRPLISITGDINVIDSNFTVNGNVVTYTTKLDSGSYKFNIKENDTVYGVSGTSTNIITDKQFSVTSTKHTLTAYGGTYTFAYNYETHRLTVTYTAPVIRLTGQITGNMTVDSGTGIATYSINLHYGDNTYGFNITEDGVSYGVSGTSSNTMTDKQFSPTSAQHSLKAYGGTYNFTYNYYTNKLTVAHEGIVVLYYYDDIADLQVKPMNVSGNSAIYETPEKYNNDNYSKLYFNILINGVHYKSSGPNGSFDSSDKFDSGNDYTLSVSSSYSYGTPGDTKTYVAFKVVDITNPTKSSGFYVKRYKESGKY